jgi:hypothetical protein
MNPEIILNDYIDQPNTLTTLNVMQARLNEPINIGIRSSSRDLSLTDYGNSYTFNYDFASANTFLTIGNDGQWRINGTVPIPQKTITANFVEIGSNPGNDESPFMCQIGKATIIKGSEKFFEEYDVEVIKSSLKAMVFRVLKIEPDVNVFIVPSSTFSNKRWICKNPLKAVDIIKEALDDALCEITQRFYATQKKLQQFKLIKG